MLGSLTSHLTVLLSALGLAGTVDVTTGASGAVAITVVLIAAALVVPAAIAARAPAAGRTSPPHPRRAIDASALVAQSDPDAPGHPRPRAPQSAAPAA